MDKERLEKLRELGEDELVEEELCRFERRSGPLRFYPELRKRYLFTALEIQENKIEGRILLLLMPATRCRSFLSRHPIPKPRKRGRGPVSGRQWRGETVSWLRDRDRKNWGRR